MKYNISTNYHTLNHWQSCKKKKINGWPKYGDWDKNYVKYGYNESAKFYPKYGYMEIIHAKCYPKYGKNENARFYIRYGVIE